jgi:hypothetical protein
MVARRHYNNIFPLGNLVTQSLCIDIFKNIRNLLSRRITMFALYAIKWTEYERGWGQRPDGTTFFASKEHGSEFLDGFYHARISEQGVPDEYDSPSDMFLSEVSQKLHEHVTNSVKGQVWIRSQNPDEWLTWEPTA